MPDFSLIHSVQPARSGSPPHPALVLLHGLGSDERDMMTIAPHVDPRLYVFGVRAPMSYRWGGYAWYDYEGEGPGLGGRSLERSLNLLRRFLDEIVEEYPIDPSRRYIGGFSMGAAMSGAFTLLEPELVAGTVMASGFLSPDAVPARYRGANLAGLPIFQAHGTRDQTVPILYARQTRDYLEGTAATLTYREYPIGHEVSLEELLDLAGWLDDVLNGREVQAQL